VQERLGHATIKQTLDTYTHLIPGMQDAATNQMESAVFGDTLATRLESDGTN